MTKPQKASQVLPYPVLHLIQNNIVSDIYIKLINIGIVMKNNKFNQQAWSRNLVTSKTNEEVESTKELTTEGIVDGIIKHIHGILSKTNDKQYQAQLQALADESPEGKVAVNKLLKALDRGDAAVANVDRLNAKYAHLFN